MNPLLILRSVSKSYIYWEDRPYSIKKTLAEFLKGQFKSGNKRQIQVLSDISFDVRPGEFVGIMGRNGVGKSTLLKLISGIYTPTSGDIIRNGSIAPLLELGAGFADELSGYENIFLNASFLGFGRKRTLDAVQSIIDFSELGDRIHMPIRNYSSGMLVRLGFSIAVHMDAPLLLFDEILAVGDLGFQQKSLAKILELNRQGRAIILVTHDPGQVVRYCQRCIVIDHQRIVFDGDPARGAAVYASEFPS